MHKRKNRSVSSCFQTCFLSDVYESISRSPQPLYDCFKNGLVPDLNGLCPDLLALIEIEAQQTALVDMIDMIIVEILCKLLPANNIFCTNHQVNTKKRI